MKRIIVLLSLIALSKVMFAQQEAMFTHYMYNTLGVNPAYAGSRDALTVTGIHRSQWVGFDGAPVTQTLTLHSPIFKEELGVGLSVINDKIGPTNLTSFYGDFAYRMKVSETAKLAFGLKAGLNVMQAGLTSLELINNTDQSFQSNLQSKALPNFGFGMYYSSPKFYAGISSPRLLENDYFGNKTSGGRSLRSEKRHYFFIAGGIFDLNESIKFKPTTFVKATNGAPIEADFTGSLVFNDLIWGGLMFRTGDAFGILAGLNLTKQFQLGYSFDWSFGLNTGRYNGGSHEIMLLYDFVYRETEKIRSPRYF